MASGRSGEVIAGRYRIVDTLGEGGYGTVYDAVDVQGGHSVALKLLHLRHTDNEVQSKRFRREAAVLLELRHPSVVRTLDYGHDEEGVPYIAFERLHGRTLRDELKAYGPMATERVATVMRQMLGALAAAHELGVIHRDIKPANIFLCGRDADDIKVLDFGIAKASLAEDGEELTATGQMLGTPQYMAPEQVRGDKIDERVDVYAVGVVMSEMISGAKLVTGDSDIDVYMKHVSDEELDLPPSVRSTPLSRIVERAVSKHPGSRFSSASEMLEALNAAMQPASDPLGGTLLIPESLGDLDETLALEDAQLQWAALLPPKTEDPAGPKPPVSVISGPPATPQPLAPAADPTVPQPPSVAFGPVAPLAPAASPQAGALAPQAGAKPVAASSAAEQGPPGKGLLVVVALVGILVLAVLGITAWYAMSRNVEGGSLHMYPYNGDSFARKIAA